jgi:hypothetical protein
MGELTRFELTNIGELTRFELTNRGELARFGLTNRGELARFRLVDVTNGLPEIVGDTGEGDWAGDENRVDDSDPLGVNSFALGLRLFIFSAKSPISRIFIIVLLYIKNTLFVLFEVKM